MLIVAIRTVILYAFLVLVTRVMGKRQVGELQPFEFVTTILLAELAAIPMGDKEAPLLNGVVAIFSLLVAHVSVSFWALKSQAVRCVVCGRPSVLIARGVIQENELRNLRYNLNDLLEQLREKGYPNIAEVEYAILETNGRLSVIPKSQHRPVTPADMQLKTTNEGLPVTLIVDGKVDRRALQQANLNKSWLNSALARQGIENARDVFFASVDSAGRLFCQAKQSLRREG